MTQEIVVRSGNFDRDHRSGSRSSRGGLRWSTSGCIGVRLDIQHLAEIVDASRLADPTCPGRFFRKGAIAQEPAGCDARPFRSDQFYPLARPTASWRPHARQENAPYPPPAGTVRNPSKPCRSHDSHLLLLALVGLVTAGFRVSRHATPSRAEFSSQTAADHQVGNAGVPPVRRDFRQEVT